MTRDTYENQPSRRLADQGTLGKIKTWWREWGLLITGVWLIVVSGALLYIGIAFYSSQAATETAAKASCERSLKFGPELADAYERFEILSSSSLKAYRDTIPVSCPQ